MAFYLPERVATQIRGYEKQLFFEENLLSLKEKREIFYLLLKDILRLIIQKSLEDLGLEQDEIESEIFLLSCAIFNGFKAWKRSSIVPYLDTQIPWHVSDVFERIEKERKNLPKINVDDTYEITEEVYLRSLYFLFENKYLAKNLTLPQRYLINRILGLDDKELTASKIADSIHVERKTAITKLLELREAIKELKENA